MLTSKLKLILLMLASISVGILISEGLLAILYFYQHQEWFYTRRNHSNRIYGESMITERPKADGLPKRLHPFLGYVYEPNKTGFDGNARHNNLGFIYKGQSVLDMPYVPQSSDERIIGVFGGSVASNLVWAPRGGLSLAEALQKKDTQRRKLTVLNLGQGAWKQPQQLLALNYFLSLGQRFDVIVNIDGFNEVALGYHNLLSGVDYSLPSAHVLLPLVRLADVSAQYDYLVPMVNAMRSHRLLMECDFKGNLAKYAITHQLYTACSTWANRGLLNANAQLESYGRAYREDVKDAESIYALNFRDRGRANQDFFTAIADQWANSSVLMSNIAQSNNVRYIHIIQPNQHYSRHRFDGDEKAVAFNIAKDDAFVVGALQGYPALLNAMSKMMRGGLNVHSAIDIFDNIEEHVYADECCHYNARGESLLADFVAAKVIGELCHFSESESCNNRN